jgi:hypothetical protein
MKSCKEVHKLLHSEEDLGLMEKIKLRIHTIMCKHCNAYRRHLQLVRQGVAKWVEKASDVDPERVKDLEKKFLRKTKRRNNSD